MHCKKRKYRDKDSALQALHTIQNKHDGRKKPIRAYECDLCGKWHLTSLTIDQPQHTDYKLKLDWSKLFNNKAIMKTDEIIEQILTEVKRAETKHPNWPVDLVYSATIVAEENGELTRACLQYQCEGGTIEEVRKEAIHTAATAIRLLKNLNY